MRDIIKILTVSFGLIRPFGLWRLAIVLTVGVAQALAQLISVSAILPFLTLVSSTGATDTTSIGKYLTALFPDLSRVDLIYLAGGLLIGAFILSSVMAILAEVIRTRYTWQLAHWLRTRIIACSGQNSLQWFTNNHSSSLVKRLTQDVNQFCALTVGGTIQAVGNVLVVVLMFAGMVAVNPSLALSSAALLVSVFSVIFFALGSLRRWLSNTLNAAWREVFKEALQYYSGIRVARIFGAEDYLQKRIGEASKRQAKAQTTLPLLNSVPRYLVEATVFSALVIYVIYTVNTTGTVVNLIPTVGFFAMALHRMLPATQTLYATLSNLTATKYLVHEVSEGLARGTELSPVPTEPVAVCQPSRASSVLQLRNSLRLDNVSFRYANDEESGAGDVLQGVNLEILASSNVGFVGTSGAGKSTLIDIILGAQLPTVGHVSIDGVPLTTEFHRRIWQRTIGYVPQDPFLIDDTIARNIAFGIADADIDYDLLMDSVSKAQLERFIENELPDKFETVVGERGVRLSGGQRQRLALARAIYRRPTVLVFDEATSALDNATEARVLDAVFGLSPDITKIFVAHRVSSLDRCDAIYRVEAGKVLPTTLLAHTA